MQFRFVSNLLQNLGLGLFEDRSHKNAQCNEGSEMSVSSSSDTSDISERDNDPDSDMDSDASSEIITCFVPSRPIRPLPRRLNKRPEIVVLGEAGKSWISALESCKCGVAFFSPI